MDEHKIIESQRGGKLLITDFIYNLEVTNNEFTRWRCNLRTCKARLKIFKDSQMELLADHNHQSDTKKRFILLKRYELKITSRESRERPTNLLVNMLKSVDDEQIQMLPIRSSLVNTIRRERNKDVGFLKGEVDDIPEKLKIDRKGNLFLRYDSGYNSKGRFLIFMSEFKRELAIKSTIFTLDGTFKVTPSGFYQMLTIHTFILGRTYPICYVLMQDKTLQSYENVFLQVKKIFLFEPIYMVSDLEIGLKNSVLSSFNSSKHFGCFFHFSQAVWKKVQILGLVTKYKSDNKFLRCVRKLLALSFLKTDDVLNMYVCLRKEFELFNCKSVDDLIYYFEKLYIGQLDEYLKVIKFGVYEIEFWNVYDRVLLNIPRTTNNLEAWNNSFNKQNEISHPNIAYLIEKMLNEEELNRMCVLQAKKGKFDLQRKQLIKEEKIRLVVQNYNYFKPSEYLDIIVDYYDFKLD